MMVIPLVILDIFLEIYHHISFRLYGLEVVKRRDYIKFGRHELPYLTIAKKFFCIYCAYANGLIHYASVIAGKTEEYWCGIRHNIKEGESFIEHDHHKCFLAYGDKGGFDNLKLK